jgi:hypothetical protein
MRQSHLSSSASNSRGFGLVEALAALGISAAVFLASSTLISNISQGDKASELSFWIMERRIEFQSIFRSASGWQDLVQANPDMQCFAKLDNSCQAFSSPQPLHFPINATVLDGTSSSLGLSRNGDFCTSFNAQNEDGSCPVGLKMSWQAVCDDAKCLHAQPRISIQFSAALNSKYNFDYRSFDLNLFRDARQDSGTEICEKMNGEFNGQTCRLRALSTFCNPVVGQFVLGFDKAGVVICGPPDPGSCAASDMVIGFDNSGGALCTSACP